MKRILLIPALALVAGAAHATLFTNIQFGTNQNNGGPVNPVATFTAAGDSLTVTFQNATFSTGNQAAWDDFLDIQWTHLFDTALVHSVAQSGTPSIGGASAATLPYNQVTLTIQGQYRAVSPGSVAGLGVLSSEEIRDMSTGTPGTGTPNSDFQTFSTGSLTYVPFSIVMVTNFSALQKGMAVKDLLFLPNANTEGFVSSVTQTFTPVPEPGTIAALALGAGALLRRRNRR